MLRFAVVLFSDFHYNVSEGQHDSSSDPSFPVLKYNS